MYKRLEMSSNCICMSIINGSFRQTLVRSLIKIVVCDFKTVQVFEIDILWFFNQYFLDLYKRKRYDSLCLGPNWALLQLKVQELWLKPAKNGVDAINVDKISFVHHYVFYVTVSAVPNLSVLSGLNCTV